MRHNDYGVDDMALPKVNFREMTSEENINVIKWAYFEDNEALSVHDFTIKCFPELANIDSKITKEEIYKIIEEVVANNYNEHSNRIKNETKRYKLLWEQYNDSYLETLSSYLEVEWPHGLTEIIATVGLLPVFPRYLDDFSFSIEQELRT